MTISLRKSPRVIDQQIGGYQHSTVRNIHVSFNMERNTEEVVRGETGDVTSYRHHNDAHTLAWHVKLRVLISPLHPKHPVN